MPVAVSCVALTKLVVSAVPARDTCAPETKLAPVSVMANAPVEKLEGVTVVRAGTGLRSVTALVPVAEESAALTAVIVTVFGFGSAAGGV